MKKLTWLLLALFPSVVVCLHGLHERNQFDVANVVEPLINDITSKACGNRFIYIDATWSGGADLIFKDIQAEPDASYRCISGVNKEMFVRCYQWVWATDMKSIGKGGDFKTNHLFRRPIKDVDLNSFTCVDTNSWPYQDKDWKKHPIGVIYEVN